MVPDEPVLWVQRKSNTTVIQYVYNSLRRPTNALGLYECNFITQQPATCFDHSRGHLRGGKCKNTNIFTVCLDHPKLKSYSIG